MDNVDINESGPFWERLQHWLSLPAWNINEAYFMLSGVLPEVYTLSGSDRCYWTYTGDLTCFMSEDDRQALIDKMDYLERYWKSLCPEEDSITPNDWINWAVSIDFVIPWLETAKNGGCLPDNYHISESGNTASVGIDAQKELSGNRFKIKEPQRKNDWFYCIKDHALIFFKEHNKLPLESQLWAQLYSSSLSEWSLSVDKKNGQIVLGGKALDRETFKKRYREYFPKDKGD